MPLLASFSLFLLSPFIVFSPFLQFIYPISYTLLEIVYFFIPVLN